MGETAQQDRVTDHFTVMYQDMEHYPTVGVEVLADAINKIGIEKIIDGSDQEAKADRNQNIADDDYTTVINGNKVVVKLHCYISPRGTLQVWAEAATEDPELNILATARFSWADENEEALKTHQKFIDKLFKGLHP